MSSLHISILFTLLTIIIADNNHTLFFTKSNYDLWCQENLLSNSLFVYPNRIPIGIYRTSNIKTVTYDLINDDNNNGLFQIKTRRLANFYFLIINITRPFDINREYQDVYTLHIQANIIATERNYTDRTEIRLYVADSNDNDGVFDMDIYEQTYNQSLENSQLLLRFHATDADEIHHAQILYELGSSLNETFSLHPLTGDLYLSTNENLESKYEFDIYAYDRYRKRLVDNNMKTKTHVKLNFPNNKNLQVNQFQTITNRTIEYKQQISSYEINISERKLIYLINIHQPFLTIDIKPLENFYEIFILNNSSFNTRNLFVYNNNIYLNQYIIEEYSLQLMICFNQRSECQYSSYRYIPIIDFNLYEFQFKKLEKIDLDENLPVDSYITRIEIDYKKIYSNDFLIINYKLLNDEKNFQFYIHPKTGILRLAERLEYRIYTLDIQANIQLFNRRYSIETTIEIHVREINKYRPMFSNNTPTEFFQLPYQFQAIDFDQDKQTNGRITYRLSNCERLCPFEIDPDNGLLSLNDRRKNSIRNKIYDLQIIAFDWGQPIRLENRIDIQINLSNRLQKRDLTRTRAYSRRWRKKTTANLLTTTSSTERSPYTTTYPTNTDTIYLNIGFVQNLTTYHLSEDAAINTIIDRLKIEYDAFPLNLNDERDNLFFYTMNDTTIPFIIDQTARSIKLIDKIDREKQHKYIFEVELKLKSIYSLKLQEKFNCQNKNSLINFQYTNKYYQKMIIIIYINDVNDHIPICKDFHSSIQLNENQIQENIYRVQAYDLDLGDNGTIIYSLFDYQQYFSINPSTGVIDCIKPLDHEEYSSIDLHIIASDQGSQPQLQTICTTIHITINDINDNTPQFSSNTYVYTLFSDMPRYSIFGQISARDDDTNDKISYSLSPNPYITINKSTGHLRLKHYLHRLIDQILNVTVQISDGLHKNQTSLQIYIKSYPDAQEPILLSEPGYGLTINQSLSTGSIVTNIYRRFQLVPSTIDFIEIIYDDDNDGIKSPFEIDQQGNLRLTKSLIASTKSTYWLSIRLTRYRAHPPHTYLHIHISIREENLYYPQCVNFYQNFKVYDYLINHPFTRIQVKSLNKNSQIQYALENNEKIFSIDKQTGHIQLLPSIQKYRRIKSDYLLTIKAFDSPSKLSTNCYLNIHLIRRRELIPKFLSSSTIDLPEIDLSSGKLRQRLFQIVALLNPNVYDKKLQIRYRFTDTNQYFIINRQTGYIAAKQPLNSYTTYEFNIEAFTVAYRDEIYLDDNNNDEDEQFNRGKWRIVSSRVNLPIKIRILSLKSLNKSLLPSTIDSTINIDLLMTTNVGTTILQLGLNNPFNNSQWFIMIGNIRHTQYFHVDFQSGQLILIRPIAELINQTNLIELHINVTHDWIHMNTIKVLIRLINNQIPLMKFSQNDYYSSISKSIPVGVEIARLTIENSVDDCIYSIDRVERLKSKDLFRSNSYTGSITVANSLENSSTEKHLLTIIYRCEHQYYIASTNLHIHILDERNLLNQTNKSFRFIQENYLIIFETTLIQNQKKYLLDLQLINEQGSKIKPQAKIIQGDPLSLFAIDSSNQSLYLVDESLSRSYIYPINLTIIDLSQIEPINTTVIIFISNIGIHFPCPSYLKTSPFLFTYESLPKTSIDPLTGQIYKPYNSLIIRAFDPFTPLNKEASNQAECIINSDSTNSNELIIKNLDFVFENEVYSGYINDSFGLSSYIYNNKLEPIQIQLKNSTNFDLTYYLLNQTNTNLFQLDEYAGLIKFNPMNKSSVNKYSFIIYAQYKNLLTFTRLNILMNHKDSIEDNSLQSIYEFKLYTPFVNNDTIGYLNKTKKTFTILNEHILPMIAIDNRSGRLFVQNRTLLLTNGNFYDFLIQDQDSKIIRIQIIILTPIEPTYECRLNYINSLNNRKLIGFIEILNQNQTYSMCDREMEKSFYLLNYNQLFSLDRQYGLLYYRNQYEIMNEDLLLLIQIDNSRCLITIEKAVDESGYQMIRNGSQLYKNLIEQYDIRKSSGQIKFINDTTMTYDIISAQSPIFSQKSYEFSLNLSNTSNHSIYVGQISAQPYDIYRSHLVYQFVNQPKHFLLNIDNGTLEYIPNEYYNKTLEQFQIIVRDLIYQQNTTINVTIHIFKPERIGFSSLIYHQIISEILPPGSLIFQPNISTNENLQYSLENYNSNLFEINPLTGQVYLLNYLTNKFYSFKIRLSPIDEILIIKLTIQNFNNHPPKFQNLPLNLSSSLTQSFLTKLSANDLDLNDNLHLTYHLLDKNYENLFSLNQTNGILTLKTNSLSKPSYQLNIGVSDGLYLTKTYIQIHFSNYSKSIPAFSSNEYVFQYDQSKDILGQIIAYDADLNDRISYELYLQPNEIHIDSSNGLIRITKNFFSKPIIEFYASAMDLAKQIVYTKIRIIYSVEPKFPSNLYFINLIKSQLIVPAEIFQFELVDLFNQPLKFGKFQVKNQTNLFEINQNKLILKENIDQLNSYLLYINAYWKNFILQTSVQIRFVEQLIKLDKQFYSFTIEKSRLEENYLIEKFDIKNFVLKIVSTPLTRNDCHENFYIKNNELVFKTYPILSDLCFFELQLTDNISYSSSQIEILFVDSYRQPKLSSKNYYFYFNDNQRENIFRVFANSSNSIRYQLENNSYGIFINQTNGLLIFKYQLDLIDDLQLRVYAIDEKNDFNDTALINIQVNRKKQFEIPRNYTELSLCPNVPVLLYDQSLPGTVIQDISLNNNLNISNTYYIVSGDKYGLFSINNLGQLYLTSPLLNQTSDEYCELTILISSSSSISYCRTNISISRTPKWSYFICPAMPIQWMIEEESPIGTIIGTVKETLLLINNSTDLIDKITLKLTNPNSDGQSFLLNSQTGLITSNSRLDYEQKTFYSFSITVEPIELNCTIMISIKLININDNPIQFDKNSLIYNITENNLTPYYIGRIRLIDIDQLFFSSYEFYLKNFSTQISIDSTTGSIILYEKLDREYHKSLLEYDIIATNQQFHLTDKLIIYINDINDHGPKFDQDFYSINISKSLRINSFIYQINATSNDPVANGNFTYSLPESSDYFTIDQQTGIIRLKNLLPNTITNLTLSIEVFENGINLTNQTNLYITIINDDRNYFDLDNKHNCFIEENQLVGTNICDVGKNSNDFIYELIDPMNYFQIFQYNGTIVNKKIFDYEIDQHEFNVTIIVRDRENQSIPLSSLNLTIYVHNVNDNPPVFLTKNFTTLLYLYYPSINTIIHRIEAIDKDQTNLTFEIINNTYYTLNSLLNNTIELILMKPILTNHEDNLIIRLSDNQTYYLDLYLHILYIQSEIYFPKIIPHTIDGYIDLDENASMINFGSLFIENQFEYKFINYNLKPTEHFSLKQISNNQTELYFHSFEQYSNQPKNRLLQFQIELTAVAINQSIPKLNFTTNPILYLPTNLPPSSSQTHRIDIHLWSIDHEMLDRTLSVIINLNPQSTYEQFVIDSLPLIRESLAQIIGVQIRHVHIYTFNMISSTQIELLIAIIRYPSRLRPPRYIHKKLIYNVLKNSTKLFEKILHIKSIENLLLNQCHLKSCENNGRCTSQIKLSTNQYKYFLYQTYERLIPIYQWNIKCLCLNSYYGQYCQFKQDYQSPCASNPCSALERCIEQSSTLYTCQCIDEPCQFNEILNENTLNCININSPTCRDSSNTLTFDGYSFVRMNYTLNISQHINLTLTFRTEVTQGKLISLINKKTSDTIIIQIHNGYINLELNKKILFTINDMIINDSLWHKIYFSIDYTTNNQNFYYLIRLDNVFSNKISLYQPKLSNQYKEFIIGNDFHGCLGNLTINNHIISLQKQDNQTYIEHIGTNNGCQLSEIETRTLRQYETKDDLCTLYHPCYHGGICTNENTYTFRCQCLKDRFSGRQCQKDLQPCQSHPCSFNEQCITTSNNSYSCISSLIHLPMSTKNPLYIGIAVLICICILILLLFLSLIIYCQEKLKEKKRKIIRTNEKTSVSSPLLIPKSSPTTNNQIESPMQTLLKLNSNGKQTIETMALVDSMNNFNDKSNNQPVDKQQYQSRESLNRNEPKYYSTIGRMNIPPDNFLVHYNSIDYDNTRTPLVDPQSKDVFEFPSSPTKYFNGHNDENSNNYQIRINSLSNLTEKLVEQNDIELTHSSNESSNNEQTFLTSPVSNGERKRSLFNGGSTHSVRASTSSLQKAPVYAKVIKTAAAAATKSTNGGMSTIERLRLSGSPLRLLSSSPTYTRATSFLKGNSNNDNENIQISLSSTSTNKTNKLNSTSWKINPRKLDSLKVKRHSRHMDDDDEEEDCDDNHHNNNETSHLTVNRLRHASESDLTKGNLNGKKSTKLSSFFQTEV